MNDRWYNHRDHRVSDRKQRQGQQYKGLRRQSGEVGSHNILWLSDTKGRTEKFHLNRAGSSRRFNALQSKALSRKVLRIAAKVAKKNGCSVEFHRYPIRHALAAGNQQVLC